MKNNITLRIIIAFSILIIFSFIGELIPGFLGDWVCEGGCTIKDEWGQTFKSARLSRNFLHR